MKIDYLDFIITIIGKYNYDELVGILDGVFDRNIPRDYKQISKDEQSILIFKKIKVKEFNEINFDRNLRIKLNSINLSLINTKYLTYDRTIWSIIRAPILISLPFITIFGTGFSIFVYFFPN